MKKVKRLKKLELQLQRIKQIDARALEAAIGGTNQISAGCVAGTSDCGGGPENQGG